mmetsp:Transcript_70803/g.112525  ORF Transcript_70803/g.112525 Transcript_70803/m.112525 type:complete len:168 (-) Transcript_70803:106-609(-)
MQSTQVLDIEQRIKGKVDLSLRIKIYCAVNIVFCTPFFLWALYHVIWQQLFDLGCITFPLVIVACILGLLSIHYYHAARDDRARSFGRFHCFMIVISHILLTANWAAGAILEEDAFWISSWMILMAMLYAVTSFVFGRWSYKWYNLFSEGMDYGRMEDEYDKDLEKL